MKVKVRSGESRAAFVKRVHDELADKTANERNRLCFKAWEEHDKDAAKLAAIMEEKFPPDRFVLKCDVPIFDVHDDEDGDSYTKEDLLEIIDKNNERAMELGSFSPISVGHTPDDDDKDEPPVLGFGGNLKLGMIGEKKKRFAILWDEAVYKEEEEKHQKLPRRSVEIWRSEKLIDPVAALGSTTPRRDMGLSYHYQRGGKDVVRYSMAAAPSGTNTFIPGHGGNKRKEKHEMAGLDGIQSADSGLEDSAPKGVAEQVLEALMATPEWQKLTEMVAEDQADSAPMGDELGVEEDLELEADPGLALEDDELPPEDAEQFEKEDEDDEDKEDYEADEDEDEDDDVDKNILPALAAGAVGGALANGKGKHSRKPKRTPSTKRDAKMKYAKLQAEHRRLKGAVSKMQRDALDAYREAELMKIARAKAINVSRELKRTAKYSRKQFDAHCNLLVDVAETRVIDRTLPVFEDTQDKSAVDKFQKDAAVSQKVLAIAKQRMSETGKEQDISAIRAEVEAGSNS